MSRRSETGRNGSISDSLPQTLSERGTDILKDVLKSPIFSSGLVNEQVPSFARDDIKLGEVLGFGTFGVVREVTEIRCSHAVIGNGMPNTEALVDSSSFLYLNDTLSGDAPAGASVSPTGVSQHLNQNDRFDMTRMQMSTRCFRGGDARYALKHLLLEDANEKESDNARIDLAIEVKYLQVLSHPHIIKLRGLFQTDDPFHLAYFFIMDRLYDTLEDKMKEWTGCQRSLWKETFSSCYGDSMDHEYIPEKDLMTQRLLVAHDIASAFDYMHTNKVLHRDIKPQNMGFDVRGNIKVFDFGLAKSLVPELQAQCGLLYNLTAKSGSLPYMAPEVAMAKPYNEKCDVYSFGILFYEIVALKPPFSQHALKNYTAKVLKGGARPPIKRTFPSCTKKILKSSWSVSHTDRPDMATIVKLIQSDVELLEQGALVHARSNHMMNLSKHSLNGGRDDKKSSSQGFDDDKHPVKVLSVF